MTLQRGPERNEAKFLHKFADFAGKQVSEIGCGTGALAGIQLDKPHIGVGVDEGLLANLSNLFDRSHAAGVLRAQIPRKLGFSRTKGYSDGLQANGFDLLSKLIQILGSTTACRTTDCCRNNFLIILIRKKPYN